MVNCQLSIVNVCAQPNKKAGLSLVKIATTKADGTKIGETTGFAIPSPANQGEVEIVSPYTIFKQAVKATVSDAKGKTTLAHRITGASDLYDVVRFTVDKATMAPLPVATAKLDVGSKAYILQPTGKGKTQTIDVTIGETPEQSGLTYYTIFRPSNDALTGCPLLNAKGEVVGVIQRGADNQADKTYAIGIEFNEALTVNTMSAADPAL